MRKKTRSAGENIDRLADAVIRHVDIDAIIRVRQTSRTRNITHHPQSRGRTRRDPGAFRLAVAYDKAFSFYYEDNLDLMRDAGAEIIRFSPLVDRAIPDRADAVYIGGGYPELHAEALSRNRSMLASVHAWANAGKPLYAECGGMMYLSKGIRDFDNRFFAMAGVFPFETRMTKKPRLGYREILLNEDCIIGARGERCRGHEFHYSEIREGAPGQVYSLCDSRGKVLPAEGFRYKNTLASYVHVHFGSNRRIVGTFCRFWQGRKNRMKESILLLGHGSPKKDANNLERVGKMLHGMLHAGCTEDCVKVAYLQFAEPGIIGDHQDLRGAGCEKDHSSSFFPERGHACDQGHSRDDRGGAGALSRRELYLYRAARRSMRNWPTS